MEITYELTEDDIVALHRLPANPAPGSPEPGTGSPSRKHISWIWLGILVIVVTTLVFLDAGNGPGVGADFLFRKIVIPFGLISFAIVLAFARRRRGTKTYIQYWLRLGQNARTLGPQRLTITPAALTVTMALEATTSSWKLVKDIRVTSDHAFFWLISEYAYVLPGRAFPTRQAFDEFVAAGKQYRQLAQANSEETTHSSVLSPFPADFASSSSASGSHSSHQVQEVAFQLTEEDVLAFLRLPQDQLGPEVKARRLLGWRDLVRMLVAAAVAVGIFVWLDGGGMEEWLIYFGSTLAFLVGLLGWLRFRNRASRRCVRRLLKQPIHARLLEPQQMQFTPAGLTQITSLATTTQSWKLVDHITVTGDHAFVILVDLLCYVIPRGAFARDEHFGRFVETIESYWDMARRF
jgi:hypothetical protein